MSGGGKGGMCRRTEDDRIPVKVGVVEFRNGGDVVCCRRTEVSGGCGG